MTSISTERLLVLANRAGIPIFQIDQTNLAQILPQLDTFPIVKQNITDFVNAGFIAVVPQRNQQVNDWRGMGWIVADLNTGSEVYFIAGLLTGIQGEASLSQGRTTPWIRAGGLTTQVTSAEDISPEEAQRRKEFAEQLREIGRFTRDIALILVAIAAFFPILAGPALFVTFVAALFFIAAILVERGVLPVDSP